LEKRKSAGPDQSSAVAHIAPDDAGRLKGIDVHEVQLSQQTGWSQTQRGTAIFFLSLHTQHPSYWLSIFRCVLDAATKAQFVK